MKILPTAPLSDKINNWIYSSIIAVALLFCSQDWMCAQISRKQSNIDQVLSTQNQNISEDTVIVRGVVRTFSDSTALAGVKVLMKVGLIFTETDSLGRFELTLINEFSVDTLEFSFQGLSNQKRTWESEELDVYMDSILVPLAGRISCLVGYRWWQPRQVWWRIKSAFRRTR